MSKGREERRREAWKRKRVWGFLKKENEKEKASGVVILRKREAHPWKPKPLDVKAIKKLQDGKEKVIIGSDAFYALVGEVLDP